MKQVIFIGGTSYSGTTYLDLTLGNDPHGFSCGEVRDYFHPTKSCHTKILCSCGDETCSIWSNIKAKGEDNIYNSIYELFPDVEIITDSSKDPYWIANQTKLLKSNGIKTTNILIWKTPYEIAMSYYKRGRLSEWHKRWINYHRLYYTTINQWLSVRCSDLINNSSALEKICDYAGISYFENKKEYQNKITHTIFGNNSARIDKYHKNSQEYSNIKSRLSFKEEGMRNLDLDRELIEKSIKNISTANHFVNEIEEVLRIRDILHCKESETSEPDIKLSSASVLWRSIKRSSRFAVGKTRYSK